MSAPRVAVTGAGSLFGQGIIRCLLQADPAPKLLGLDYFETAVGLRWVHDRALLPDLLAPQVTEDDWFEALCGHVSSHGCEVLFVGVDFELLPLARRRDQLLASTGCRAVVSAVDLVSRCKDKYLTAQLLQSIGAPSPRSFLPQDGLERIERELTYPMIVKPRFGSRSRGVHVVRDRIELAARLSDSSDPVIQEFLPGEDEEFTCGICVLDGRLDSVAVLRRRLKDGNTFVAYSEGHPEIEAFCEDLGRRLSPFGPLNLQLRRVDSRPIIFEINPRFSGTTMFRARLGLNEPERVLRHVLGLPLPPAPRLRRGRVLRYYDELVELVDR